jgi:H+/gluconate symporter-like permease
VIKELVERISSYNLFNNLLPGILYVYAASTLTNFNLIVNDILIGAFVYYFTGMIISRFGSLIVEPVLKWTKFVKFADYKSYISACEKDSKIELLSEGNNMFRTFISLFIIVLLTIIYDWMTIKFCIPIKITVIGLILGLLILFLFSYRKQTNFIRKRVEKQIKQ